MSQLCEQDCGRSRNINVIVGLSGSLWLGVVQLGRNLAATQAYYYAHQGFPCHSMFQENSSQGSHMTAIELRKALPDHLRTKTAAGLADTFRK